MLCTSITITIHNKVIHNWINVTVIADKYIVIQHNTYKMIVLHINVIEFQ